ncbi:NADP-dependent oxidoreductase [Nonomuraea sp. NPDC005983]|uniref:NADP-dependent oxidoreductase n=1 Tax=Nonomuraea sp. NPDC005983 TaxID=3155595 RepID=UPI0033B199B0
MRAIAITEFGADPEIVQLPAPEPAPDELFVRIRAAGYNPVDLKIASGAMKNTMPYRFPMILGVDGAGVVEAVGVEVTRFKPGDEVYGRFLDTARGLGSYAEYGVVSQDGPVALMPKGMIAEQAAAVPTATCTAHDLVETARLDTGQTVLIVGATGGVGQSAIQLAALRGARVIASASPDADELMRELGAVEIADRLVSPIAEQVLDRHPDGLDAVFDLVSPADSIEQMAELLHPGGVIISTIHSLDPSSPSYREIRAVNLLVKPTGQLLSVLADLIDGGQLRVHIESQVPFDQAPALLRDIAHGHARGKTVIKI